MNPSISFTGSVPANYDRYMGPVMFEPYAIETAHRIAPAKKLLELAAGTGRVSRHLAGRVDTLVATDISQDMLDIAGSQVHAPSIDFMHADAMNLPFEENSFDGAVCQFGAMFFPDRTVAFREARRILRPGGRFLMTVWGGIDINLWAPVAVNVCNEMLPSNLHVERSFIPFSYCDEALIERDLRAGGFESTDFSWVEKEFAPESADEIAMGMVCGSLLSIALEERGLTDFAPFVVATSTRMKELFGDPPRTPMHALYIEAS